MNNKDKFLISEELESNAEIIKEKKVKSIGGVRVRGCCKGRLLGKGGFGKCCQFTCLGNERVFASKVVPKSNLVESRAK